jgi:CHAT domain-containing protein
MTAAILGPLQPVSEARLDRIPWVVGFPDRDLAAAALIMRLVSHYAYGSTPDEVIARLVASASDCGHPMADDDARDLVSIAILMVHSATLPGPRWWTPLLHAEHLAIACVRAARGSSIDSEGLIGERLMFDTETRETIIEVARHEPGVSFSMNRENSDELAERIEDYIESEAETTLKNAAMGTHEVHEGRLDLVFARAQALQMGVAVSRAREAGDEEVLSLMKAEVDELEKAMAGLSLLEVELMREVSADEQLLMDAAGIAKKVFTVSREMVPTGLSDLIGGERGIPRGMEIYLGLAGQTFQQRVGLIISWSVTFERLLPDGFQEEGPIGVGVGFVESVDTEFILRTTYDGEAADSHIYYPAGSAVATLALAVLALTRTLRLDFYILTGARSIQHVAQRALLLEEAQQAEIAARAVERCRELMAGGEGAVIAAVNEEYSGRDAPLIAFLMNDSGKSEQLLDARSPSAALGPGQTATREQERELVGARRHLLLAEARRIEEPGDSTRSAAEKEAAAYLALVQRSRGPRERMPARDSMEDVDRLIDAVASERTAVVHMTIDSRGLELVWADRAGGETEVELINSGDIDLDELAEALRDPENGSIVTLDRPEGAGRSLGSRIARRAEGRGIERLLICSTRNLHQLPVHALPIEPEGARRLLDLAEVSYAPSAAIVSGLARLEPRPGPAVLAAGGGLNHAEDEAALVGALLGAKIVLTGEDASPAPVLDALGRASRIHICAHGNYAPRDYLASSISLPTAADPDGELVVARILADADLAGIELAVLGACQSGAGQTEASTLDVAGGIDTAFLAAGVRNVLSALWEIDDLGALLFHGQFHLRLAAGDKMFEAYRSAVDLLRSGDWRRLDELPLGEKIVDLGIDLREAFREIEPGDDGDDAIDFTELSHWAPYRVCGLGEFGA